MTANGDGPSLVSYTGSAANQITVNGEIKKLASNIRASAQLHGIHWRSDYEWGLRLGEAAAISVLSQSNNYVGEDLEGFTITKFDGNDDPGLRFARAHETTARKVSYSTIPLYAVRIPDRQSDEGE